MHEISNENGIYIVVMWHAFDSDTKPTKKWWWTQWGQTRFAIEYKSIIIITSMDSWSKNAVQSDRHFHISKCDCEKYRFWRKAKMQYFGFESVEDPLIPCHNKTDIIKEKVYIKNTIQFINCAFFFLYCIHNQWCAIFVKLCATSTALNNKNK